MRGCVVLLLALVVHGSLALWRSDQYMYTDEYDDKLGDQFDDKLIVEFVKAAKQRHPTVAKQLLGLSWKSCAGSSALVDVDSLSLSSDKLYFPGSVYVSAQINVKKNLTSPLKAKVTLQKKIGWFWFNAPCENNVGSCTYSDICTMLPQMETIGLDLKCPIQQKKYSLSHTRIALPAADVPRGKYWLKVDLSHNWQRVACLEVYLYVG